MARKRPSAQDLLSSQQRRGSIGREAEIADYRANLLLPPTDERRRLFFSIYGVPGVGNTPLVAQLRHVAAECAAVPASLGSADQPADIITVMSDMADQLRERGCHLRKFERRLKAYRNGRHKLESAQNAPPGLAPAFTQTVTKVGVTILANEVPGARSVVAATGLDPATIAADVDQLRAYVTSQVRDRATAELIIEPEKNLTPVFISNLARAAAGRPVALFFDAYDVTYRILEPWLLDIYSGKYGSLPESIVMTISGRQPLNSLSWDRFAITTRNLLLRPFTAAESRSFLKLRGITDDQFIDALIKLSGGIPMLLAIVAIRPAHAADMGHPATSIAEQFLRAVPDQDRHDIAVTAALPRYLNEDVLTVLAPPGNVTELFSWLRLQLFVNQHPGYYWTYHEIVWAPMLRFYRAKSPSQWRNRHKDLAEYYADQAGNESQDAPKGWQNRRWINLTCERRYHELCADPAGQLATTLAEAVKAAEIGLGTVLQWIQLLADAGRDSDNAELSRWAENLADALRLGGQHYLTCLIDQAELAKPSLALAYEGRGECHWAAREYDLALADFSRAIELSPENSQTLARRGLTYMSLADFEAAEADLTRALGLESSSAPALVCRALAHHMMGRYSYAIDDFTQVINLAPGCDRFVAGRGLSLHAMGCHDEAISNYTSAIRLIPDFAWALAGRGVSYHAKGSYDQAIDDYTAALAIDPDLAWAFVGRGLSYHARGSCEQAAEDYSSAIALSSGKAASGAERQLTGQVLAARGLSHQDAGRYVEAIADYTSAIAIKAGFAWALARRGYAYHATERYEEAIADYTSAIAIKPGFAWALARRGYAYHATERYEEAIADYTSALDLDPDDALTLAYRGLAQSVLWRCDEALADYDRAIDADPELTWPRICREALRDCA